MVSKNIIVSSVLGIHLRPAGAMSEEAGVKCGEEIKLICEGSDEEEALEAVSSKFIQALEDD